MLLPTNCSSTWGWLENVLHATTSFMLVVGKKNYNVRTVSGLVVTLWTHEKICL